MSRIRFLRKLRLRVKIVLNGIFVIVITIVVLTIVGMWQMNILSNQAVNEYEKLAQTGGENADFELQLQEGRGDTLRMFLLSGVGVVVVGGLILLLFANKTIRPLIQVTSASTELVEGHLSRLVKNVQDIAQGDLTTEIQFESKSLGVSVDDEVGDMTRAFNNLNTGLEYVAVALETCWRICGACSGSSQVIRPL